MAKRLTILAVGAALSLSACGGSSSACARESGSYACERQRTSERLAAECAHYKPFPAQYAACKLIHE